MPSPAPFSTRHVVAPPGQLPHRGRRQADAVFMILDFFRYTNVHDLTPSTPDAIDRSTVCRILLRPREIIHEYWVVFRNNMVNSCDVSTKSRSLYQ